MNKGPLVIAVAVISGAAGWQLHDWVKGAGVQQHQIELGRDIDAPETLIQQPVRALVESNEAVVPIAPMGQSAPMVQNALAQIEALFAALYEADTDAEAQIETQLHQLISGHTKELTDQERWSDLLVFRQRLVILDPNTAEHHYQLAQVQAQLQLYDQALYSLYFILQDAVMGSKAQALEQYIKKRIRFAQSITVPLIKEGAHHVVEATLNRGKLRLLLDTGASITTLTPSAARRLDLPYDQARSITLTTAGGLVSAPLIEVQEFEVGDASVQRLQVGIVPLSGNQSFDGLLGMNFLQQFASSIDQQEGVLRLGEKS